MATNYLSAQLETVSKRLPEFFGTLPFLYNKFKKNTKVEMVGERDARYPFLKTIGGRPGTYNPDGGAFGPGSAAQTGVQTVSFFPFRMNFELTTLAWKATQSNETSRVNALRLALREAIPEFGLFLSQCYHGNGTAVLGTASAVTTHASGAKTLYTMDSATSVKWLRRGRGVIPYVNNLSSAYDAGAVKIIEQIDVPNRGVYLNGLVTSPQANDKLVFEGASGATPAGPFGLQYYINTATTGTTLGVDRALELEMLPSSVNANGVPTVWKMLELRHAMYDRRQDGSMSGLVGCISAAQQANVLAEVKEVAFVDLAKETVYKDLIPEMRTKWTWGGVPVELDPHQPTDRIDFFVPAECDRVMLPDGDVQFFTTPAGEKFFPLYDSGGSPKAATWFGLTTEQNLVMPNPGRNGVITNCSLPSYTN